MKHFLPILIATFAALSTAGAEPTVPQAMTESVTVSDSAPTADLLPAPALTGTAGGPLFGPGVTPAGERRGLAGSTFSLWRYLGSMLVMLGLFGGAIYLLNRWRQQHLGSDPARAMKVTGRLPVGGKQSVVLVRVRGEEVLIGLSPDRMDVLGRYALLDEEALDDDLIPDSEPRTEPLAPQPLQKVSNWP